VWRNQAVTSEELNRRLRRERIVPLPTEQWEVLADAYEILERHETLIAGDLLIIRVADGLAAVEQSKPQERVVRWLGDAEDARRFVEDRIETYDRMWDGCGCKIDYYS
jgi:hypothetical protein